MTSAPTKRPRRRTHRRHPAEGRSKVGLVVVDRSVFILAENRLNLAQVFAEIERLYQQPQAELHEAEFTMPVVIPGAVETFEDAGMIVMTDKRVPKGKEIAQSWWGGEFAATAMTTLSGPGRVGGIAAAIPPAKSADYARPRRSQQVAVLPETWLWQDVVTGDDGAPHRRNRAGPSPRGTSCSRHLGRRGPRRGGQTSPSSSRSSSPPTCLLRHSRRAVPLVALYNYTDTEQEFFVEIEGSRGSISSTREKSVTVAPNDIGGGLYQPTGVGTQTVKVTARNTDSATPSSKHDRQPRRAAKNSPTASSTAAPP
jgi:hypothetical protein